MSWHVDDLVPHHSQYLHEQTLFPITLRELEVETQVSADEMNRWHGRGWLSFDPAGKGAFDWGERIEVEFIRGLARSGLGDEWIDRLLARLEKPYCYDPETTFYSFSRDSWVSLPPRFDESPTEDEITACLEAWARGEDWEALRALRQMTERLLKSEPQEAEPDD